MSKQYLKPAFCCCCCIIIHSSLRCRYVHPTPIDYSPLWRLKGYYVCTNTDWLYYILHFTGYCRSNPGMSFPHQVRQPTCLGWGIWLVQSLPGKVRPHLAESFWGCLVLLWPGAVVKVILELKKSKSIKNQVIQHMTLKILLCIIQTLLCFCLCHLHIIKMSKLFRW